eukprot:9233076-Pyramimonas_sp.AAC.1
MAQYGLRQPLASSRTWLSVSSKRCQERLRSCLDGLLGILFGPRTRETIRTPSVLGPTVLGQG